MAHTLYFDGATQPNPGNTGIGFVLVHGGKEVDLGYKNCGFGTNNEAEYKALILGLERAKAAGVRSVTAFGDSQLVVKQVKGEWSVGKEELKALHRKSLELASHFDAFSINWIPREKNRRADELSKKGLMEHPKEMGAALKTENQGQRTFSMRTIGKKVIFVECGRLIVLDLASRQCGCQEYKRSGSCKHISALLKALEARHG